MASFVIISSYPFKIGYTYISDPHFLYFIKTFSKKYSALILPS